MPGNNQSRYYLGHPYNWALHAINAAERLLSLLPPYLNFFMTFHNFFKVQTLGSGICVTNHETQKSEDGRRKFLTPCVPSNEIGKEHKQNDCYVEKEIRLCFK